MFEFKPEYDHTGKIRIDPVLPAEVAEIQRLEAAGENTAKIARALQRAPSTIHRRLVRKGANKVAGDAIVPASTDAPVPAATDAPDPVSPDAPAAVPETAAAEQGTGGPSIGEQIWEQITTAAKMNIGARDPIGLDDGLQFRIGLPSIGRLVKFVIKLTSGDLYDVELINITGDFRVERVGLVGQVGVAELSETLIRMTDPEGLRSLTGEAAAAAQDAPDEPGPVAPSLTPEIAVETVAANQQAVAGLLALGVHAGVCGKPACTPCVAAIQQIQEATATEITRHIFTEMHEAAQTANLAHEAEQVGQAYIARQKWIKAGRPAIHPPEYVEPRVIIRAH